VIVFMTLTTLHAQWRKVNSPTSREITDIHFVDSENGFMSCASGTVLKTTNGGLDWQAFNTGISASFRSIFGIDKDTVYTARISLYKSTNSGVSWVDYGGLGSSGSTIFDIHFLSPKTGFIIKSGKLYKTNDYGLNWYKVYDKVYSNGNIIFTRQDTGYVVGGATVICDPVACNPPINYGEIIKTTDGGESWQKLIFFNDTLNIISVSFINNNFGYCFSSNNTIQKTEDGGLTWISINTGITGTISGALFINKSIGFITNIGQIYITTNGGMDWILEYTVSDGGLFKIGSSNKMVVAGGTNGLICVRSLDNITINKQSEYYNSKEVLIYPNPANSYATIQYNKSQAIQYLLTLRDIRGQEVLSEKVVFDKVYNMDLNNIEGGIYFLTLTNNKEQVVKKIVIQKISD